MKKVSTLHLHAIKDSLLQYFSKGAKLETVLWVILIMYWCACMHVMLQNEPYTYEYEDTHLTTLKCTNEYYNGNKLMKWNQFFTIGSDYAYDFIERVNVLIHHHVLANYSTIVNVTCPRIMTTYYISTLRTLFFQFSRLKPIHWAL